MKRDRAEHRADTRPKIRALLKPSVRKNDTFHPRWKCGGDRSRSPGTAESKAGGDALLPREHGYTRTGVIQFPAISGLRSRATGVSCVGYGNAATGWPVSSGLISRQDNPANLISTSPASRGDLIPRFTLRERSKDSAPLPTSLCQKSIFFHRAVAGVAVSLRRPSRKRTWDARILTLSNSRDVSLRSFLSERIYATNRQINLFLFLQLPFLLLQHSCKISCKKLGIPIIIDLENNQFSRS